MKLINSKIIKKAIAGILAALTIATTVYGTRGISVRADSLFEDAPVCNTMSMASMTDTFTPNESIFLMNNQIRLLVLAQEEPKGELLQTAELIYRQLVTELNYLTNDELTNHSDSNEGNAEPTFVWGKEEDIQTGDIVLHLDSSSGIDREAYHLNVTDKVIVTASDTDGLLYGSNMFMKHLRYALSLNENGYMDMNLDNGLNLQGFELSDAPDTKERTVMLDTGRKYFTKEWICNFIRQMSWMGYNILELHFSEDGGFRADFWDEAFYQEEDTDRDGYVYAPVNDFSWLCGSHVQSWVKDPYRHDPDAGNYLTMEELIEICETAKEYHIDMIPSFDSPAHMDYITWQFEQNYVNNPQYAFSYQDVRYEAALTNGCINYTGKTGASAPQWPYYTTVDITEGTMARAFVFALYHDIADFFKEYAGSEDFSIGGDEVNLNSRNLSGGYEFLWKYDQFPGYVNELNRMLNEKGYTCRMFNDFIGSAIYNPVGQNAADFDDNIEIMYWNSGFNPTSGRDDESIWKVSDFYLTDGEDRILYNCIQTNCYYVLRVAPSNSAYANMDARNPKNHNWVFYHSDEENIYQEWKPDEIKESGLYQEKVNPVPDSNLGGAYFLIWNDYAALNTEEEIWNGAKDNTGTSTEIYSLFDRMYANVIKMWNSNINEDLSYEEYGQFTDTFTFFPGYNACTEEVDMTEVSQIMPVVKEEAGLLERLLIWIRSLWD